MSAFDVQLNVFRTSVGIARVHEEAPAQMEIALEVAMALGAAPGQPTLMAPIGTVRYTLGREEAIKFFKIGLDAAETLPKPSGIAVAKDLSSAERVAQAAQNIRQKS